MTPFELLDWPCPAPGGAREEMALVFNRRRAHRLLVLPAWFDEANKLRRQTVETMRRLDAAGIDTMLPDLPGCNESEALLFGQTLDGWRTAATAAADHFRATHVLAIRAGAMLAPARLPGWAWAPTGGRQTLRGMLRARAIAAKEAGRAERSEDLQAAGRSEGIELAGWHIGPALFTALETAEPLGDLETIDQAALGGSALWLRAEPAEDAKQADALAALISAALTADAVYAP